MHRNAVPGPGNELGAQRPEQFPQLGNYTLTPVGLRITVAVWVILLLLTHFFVSDNVRCLIESMVIADSGANPSDHRAIMDHFRLHNLVYSS